MWIELAAQSVAGPGPSDAVLTGWLGLAGTAVITLGVVITGVLAYLARREAQTTQVSNSKDHGEVKALALQMKAGQEDISKKIDNQGGSIRRLHDRFDTHLEHHADREAKPEVVDRRATRRPESPGED